MQYRANKTVTRYLPGKPGVVVVKKGKTYSQEQVDKLPAYYLKDGILSAR